MIGILRSISSRWIQTAFRVARLRATYSASEVESATTACCLLSQLIGPPAIRNKFPDVECLLTGSPPQSASVYPINDHPLTDFWYFNSRSAVPFKYRWILLIAVKCASSGLAVYFNTATTAWAMSGRVSMAANSQPLIDTVLDQPLYWNQHLWQVWH